MHPKGANKNKDDQAIFSNDGPNLISPALTNKPNVIPKTYKLKKSRNNGGPSFKIETPKRGDVNRIAGIKPINVLIKAVKIKDTIIQVKINNKLKVIIKIIAVN